jgi:hypothetical protein
MFSLYRIADINARRTAGSSARTGLSGMKNPGRGRSAEYAAQAALVRSSFRLSAAEPCVYRVCRQLTELQNKHIQNALSPASQRKERYAMRPSPAERRLIGLHVSVNISQLADLVTVEIHEYLAVPLGRLRAVPAASLVPTLGSCPLTDRVCWITKTMLRVSVPARTRNTVPPLPTETRGQGSPAPTACSMHAGRQQPPVDAPRPGRR